MSFAEETRCHPDASVLNTNHVIFHLVCCSPADRCGVVKGDCAATQRGSGGKRAGNGPEGAVSPRGRVPKNRCAARGKVRITSLWLSKGMRGQKGSIALHPERHCDRPASPGWSWRTVSLRQNSRGRCKIPLTKLRERSGRRGCAEFSRRRSRLAGTCRASGQTYRMCIFNIES